MVVKTRVLTNFAQQKNDLTNILAAKVAASKVTNINQSIDLRYRADVDHVTGLLNAIESKYKQCEILYYHYFENVDHAILTGSTSNLPFGLKCTFIDGTSTTELQFSVDTRQVYKEIIDFNFQTFILSIASLYENLVLLAEIFMKKVIVYVRRPLSSPLHDYLDYLELLIKLGYRGNDKLNVCMTSSQLYFQKYLQQINQLRNKFIHGFSNNTDSDGFSYFVKNLDNSSFNSGATELLLDVFTKEILDQTSLFIGNLLVSLKDSVRHHRKSIPA